MSRLKNVCVYTDYAVETKIGVNSLTPGVALKHKCHRPLAKTWYVDGTFHVVRQPRFYQIG